MTRHLMHCMYTVSLLLLLMSHTSLLAEGRDNRRRNGFRGRGGKGDNEKVEFSQNPNPNDFYDNQQQQYYQEQPLQPNQEQQSARAYDPPYTSDSSSGQRFSNRGGEGYDASGRQVPMDDADAVPAYTKTFISKVLVATTSGMSSFMLFYVLLKMVFSRANVPVVLVLAAICSLSCFTKGDLANFSKALGVFTLLISRRTKPGNFLFQTMKGVRSLVMLSARQPFPPTDNPWKYSEPPRGSGIPFSMMNAMIGVVIMGFVTGWSVSKFIPFFPGWLGSIGCAVIFGYQCTLRDSKGDVFRYFGYAANALLSEVTTTAEDVLLKEKTSVVLGRIFAFVHRLDQSYQIIDKIKALLANLVSHIMSLVRRVQTDMEAAPPQGKPAGGGFNQ